MKRLFIVFSVLFLASGCGVTTKTLSCNTTSTSGNVTTKTKYDIDYENDDVKYVTITYDYTQDTTVTNDVDGTNADTDGIDQDNNTANNAGNVTADDVVDGVVGDAVDGAVDSVTNAILDIAGIKTTYENQMSNYDNINGFSYKVDIDSDNEYKIIYKIDMDKISDTDLTRFNIDRDLTTTRTTYENQGYTCK